VQQGLDELAAGAEAPSAQQEVAGRLQRLGERQRQRMLREAAADARHRDGLEESAAPRLKDIHEASMLARCTRRASVNCARWMMEVIRKRPAAGAADCDAEAIGGDEERDETGKASD
jgi:hypothetical protein